MGKINIWENNTNKIKKILKKEFKDNTFKIRTKNYTGGKSIWIYTDAIKNTERLFELKRKLNTGLNEKERQEWNELTKTREKNREVEKKIKELLKEFYEVDYNEFGEIMAGGNCYLFIEPLTDFEGW